MKKSFVLHNDSLLILDDLTNEEAGKLFKAIAAFHSDTELELERDIRMLFLPFRNQFIRDDATYQKTVERNRSNGLKGGRPNNPPEPTKTQITHSVISKPKKADSDSDSDSKKESDNESENDSSISEFEIMPYPSFDDFWFEYDKKVGDKEKIKKKFDAVSQTDKEKIMEHIPNYKLSQPDKQFRKDPATYLNNKSWNDEIIIKNNTQNGKSNHNTEPERKIGRLTETQLRDFIAPRNAGQPKQS